MITRVCLVLSASISIALIAWGYSSAGLSTQAVLLIVLGVAWIFGLFRKAWASSLGFALVTFAVIIGVFHGLPTLLVAASFLFAFIAWDLAEFHSRIKLAARVDQISQLERQHLLRLGFVLVSGFGLVALTRFIRLRFTFEAAAILVLAGIWGISLLVGQLRRAE